MDMTRWRRGRWGGAGAEIGEAGASAEALHARLRRDLSDGVEQPTPWRRALRGALARVAGTLVLLGVVVWLWLQAGVGYALMVATFLAQHPAGVVAAPAEGGGARPGVDVAPGR
jgi:hypothetical protein